MRFTATKAKTDDNPVTSAIPENVSLPDAPEQSDLIATNAYYKAEERGFVPGHELDDWLTAETEINSSGEKS
ncbi:MAG: DUF2934 domain-containing protein [Pseudomonadota bacterium]